jgi:hypothetical protein
MWEQWKFFDLSRYGLATMEADEDHGNGWVFVGLREPRQVGLPLSFCDLAESNAVELREIAETSCIEIK